MIQENKRLFRKPPLLGPPLSLPDSHQNMCARACAAVCARACKRASARGGSALSPGLRTVTFLYLLLLIVVLLAIVGVRLLHVLLFVVMLCLLVGLRTVTLPAQPTRKRATMKPGRIKIHAACATSDIT